MAAGGWPDRDRHDEPGLRKLSVPPPSLVLTEEDLMIGYHGYTLYQSQREKTRAERMAEDARRGELAAVLSHSWEALTGRVGHRAAGRGGGVR
jgi:hypothetical protein